MKKIAVFIVCLALIPLVAVMTAAAKQRFNDGPGRFFAGGPLIEGVLFDGVEPDWHFVRDVPWIELQLLTPPLSRRIWAAEYEGKLYVWSGYMDSFVGRLWKQWPDQAERDGRAVIRIGEVRYERQLQRVYAGEVLDGIAAAIQEKYPSRTTRQAVEAGAVWLFEAGPRQVGR